MEQRKEVPVLDQGAQRQIEPRLVAEPVELSVLHPNPPAGDPMGEDFDYAAEFKSLDLAAVKKDIAR